MGLRELQEKCREAGFNEQITQEMLWNEAYRLGRSRWYWGPMWWVSFKCWVKSKLRKSI